MSGRKSRIFLIAAWTVAIFVVVVVGLFVFVDYKLSQSLNAAKASGENFTFLMLGDAGPGAGGEWEQAPYLTDSIIVFQFIPKESVLDMVSIPRDLYGTFGTSTFKVNQAYEDGDLNGLFATLPAITGITTHNYVVVDLNFVEDVVNDMGGVNVDLPSKISDPVSGYTIAAGNQHLDGAEVDFIIRNRYESQGDFFREDNQHLVIEAIIQKFLAMNLFQQGQFIAAVSSQVKGLDSNISASEAYPLIAEGKNVSFRVVDFSFSQDLFQSSTTSVPGGSEYTLIPTAGINNYGAIEKYVTLQLQSATQTPQQSS